MLAVGNNHTITRVIGKELLLSVAGVPRQYTSDGGRQAGRVGFLQTLVTAGNAEPKPLQTSRRTRFEWLQHDSPGKLLVIFKVHVAGNSVVADSIKQPRGVADRAIENVAMKHDPYIAVWHQSRGQSSLVKECERVRLQHLQSDGSLEFPRLQLQFRAIPIVEIRIEKLRPRRSSKIRHENEIKIPEHRPLKDRP